MMAAGSPSALNFVLSPIMKAGVEINRGFSIRDLLKFLPYIRKNWWVVVLFGVLAFFIGELYIYKLDRVYAVSTQLLLKQNDDYTSGDLITGTNSKYFGNAYGTYVDNSNEIRVIQSHDLVEKALDKLNFDVSYYLVGRLKTTEVYSGIPFTVTVSTLNPDLYEQEIKFKELDNKRYELDYVIGGQSHSSTGVYGEELLDQYMSLKVVKRNVVIGPDANYMIKPHNKTVLAQSILSNLKVENPDYTNVLLITYSDQLTERAKRFLDTLSSVYMENSLESRLEMNENTVFYIDRQMEEVVNILNSIEDSLVKYRRENSVIDLPKQSDQYFSGYSDNLQKKKSLEFELRTLDDLKDYVISNRDPAFLPPDAYKLPGDDFQTGTLTNLYDLQNKLNKELQVGTLANFGVINLRNQIDSTKRDLLIYIKNTRKAIEQKITDVDIDIGYYDSELDSLPAKQRGLLNIQRRQKVNEDMYLFLLQRRANTIIARASIVPDVKIIEKPRPTGVVLPDIKKILYLFVAVGLMISLLIAAIRIMFFHRIESYEELKSKTDLPILGDVVYSKLEEDLIIAVENDPKSPLAESFRTIRTNLQFMSMGKSSQTILITSNSPGEGKTFCSLNIASIFAKSGKRTIILELDLHKPRVQKGLKLTADKGISTIAAGKHSIHECILNTRIENLSTLLSGPIPPNPSEIVSSKLMDDIIEYCKKNFEYIIIDTPPVGLITDALAIFPKVDIALFVINTKLAFRNSLNNAQEIAMMNEEVHFGFILNGVKRKKSKYYYNRYSYSYGSYGGYGSYGSYGSYGGYGNYGSNSGERKSKPEKDTK
jgi:capsular exopolysaccharide synthesis family protein